MKKALLLLLLTIPAFAQSTVPVTGTLQTYGGQPLTNAYAEFALTNCGKNTPFVSGVAQLLTQAVDFYADGSGNLTAAANNGITPALWPNDVLSCGGQFTSRYAVTLYANGVSVGPTKYYMVASGTPFNLNTATPVGVLPPLVPFPNPQVCPGGQIIYGFNRDLSPACENLPNGASNAVVTNPAGNQNITAPAGTGIVITGGTGITAPLFTGNLTGLASLNLPLTGGVLTGSLTAPAINGVINAAGQTGTDIGAKVNTSFGLLPNGGTVRIPLGTYTFSTQISMPVSGGLRYILSCDPGTVLSYTGATSGLLASGSAVTQNIDIEIDNCTLDGTSATSGANGIELKGFYGSHLTNVTARNFAGGAGIYFHGAGLSTVINPHSYNNKYGVWLVGQSDNGVPTASNAIHIFGGALVGNSLWAIDDDYSDHTATGATFNNSYEGIDFAGNGHAATTSGNIFLEASISTEISKNYFESTVGTENIQIGTNSQAAGAVSVTDNHSENTGSMNMVDAINLNSGWFTGNHGGSLCGVNAGIFSGNLFVANNFGPSPQMCGTGAAFSWTSPSPIFAPSYKAFSGSAVTVQPGTGATNSLLVLDPTNSFNAFLVDSLGNSIAHGNLTVGNSVILPGGDTITSGAGAPSGACLTGSFYTNNTAAAGTVPMYYCNPGSTWVPFSKAQSITHAGCTTTGASYDVCNVTLTWPVAFPDTSYAASCTAIDTNVIGGGSSDALTTTISTKSTTGLTVVVQTQRANTASPSEIDCVGVHN